MYNVGYWSEWPFPSFLNTSDLTNCTTSAIAPSCPTPLSSSGCNTISSHARQMNKIVKYMDTDVLMMLVHFLGATAEVRMPSETLTSKDIKCYPAHTIYQRITPEVVTNLLAFHAVTECDTVSSFAGHGKKSYCTQSYSKV